MKKSPINKGYAAKPSPMLQTTDKEAIIQAVKGGDTSAQKSDASGGIHHDLPIFAGPQPQIKSSSDLFPRTYATSTNIPASATQGATKETTYKELAAKAGLYASTLIQEGRGKGFITNKSQANLKDVRKEVKGGGTRVGKRKIVKKIMGRALPGLGYLNLAADGINFLTGVIQTGSIEEGGKRVVYDHPSNIQNQPLTPITGSNSYANRVGKNKGIIGKVINFFD